MIQLSNLIVFEMANNHQGSVDHGLRIVAEMGKLARSKGVRAAVKFQYRDLDSFIHPAVRDRRRFSDGGCVTVKPSERAVRPNSELEGSTS